ncbi:MAG: hypothetical protein V8R80_00005, partial [Eubacterium sp.]
VMCISDNSRIAIKPTSSLSMQEVEEFFELINRLRDKGIAMVYISHRMDGYCRICDSITLMWLNGKAVFCDEIENVDNHRLLPGIIGNGNPNQLRIKPKIGETISRQKIFLWKIL